jgi:hypothetical protein
MTKDMLEIEERGSVDKSPGDVLKENPWEWLAWYCPGELGAVDCEM